MKQRIKITGIEELRQRLNDAQQVGAVLDKAMKKAVLYVHQQIPPYPPPPPNSRYRRTMTLGRSITTLKGGARGALSQTRLIPGGVQGVIGTSIPYARDVIGPDQKPVHKGRWWQLETEVEKSIPGVEKIINFEIDKLLR